MTAVAEIVIERDAPLPTWFGVGGRADRLARPENAEQVRRCLEMDPNLRVLGDGANLLVDDGGVDGLVISLSRLSSVRRDGPGALLAEAGVGLFGLATETARLGESGLEVLGGIPASIGGACVMNAGGAYGQFADVVRRVHALDRAGREVILERAEIDFGYRRSGLGGLIVTAVEMELVPSDPERVRRVLKEVMAFKKQSQPLRDRSAGCVFRNPTLASGVQGIGRAGDRVSAGRLIDQAGCKGWVEGQARVSDRHGNFIVTGDGATATDVRRLMDRVRAQVQEVFGVLLEPEVVIWERSR